VNGCPECKTDCTFSGRTGPGECHDYSSAPEPHTQDYAELEQEVDDLKKQLDEAIEKAERYQRMYRAQLTESLSYRGIIQSIRGALSVEPVR